MKTAVFSPLLQDVFSTTTRRVVELLLFGYRSLSSTDPRFTRASLPELTSTTSRRIHPIHRQSSFWVGVLLLPIPIFAEVPRSVAFDPASMDRSADPCFDFYQFACGGWHAQNPRPASESFWSRPFTQFAREVDSYVAGKIESAATKSNDRTADEQKLGDFFAACLDTEAIEDRGLQPFELESRLISSMQSHLEIPSVVGELHRKLPWVPQEGEPLFWIAFSPDPETASFNRLRIGAAGLGLMSPEYYPSVPENQNLLDKYEAHIARMLQLTGQTPTSASRDAATIREIETVLAAGVLPKDQRHSNPERVENPMSLDELQKLTPHFEWADYLRAHGVPPESRVNLRDPGYLKAMDRLIPQRSLDDWKVYLRWHLLSERVKSLPKALRDERFAFFGRILREQREPPERRMTCLESVEANLPEELGRLFATSAFDPNDAPKVRRVFERVREVMRDRLRNARWLEPQTRIEALTKVEKVQFSIGRPKHWSDDPRVVIRPDDDYGNVLRAGTARRRVGLTHLGQTPSLDFWGEPVTWMGGYYWSQRNAIVATAAMLLRYDLDGEDPAELYGGLGQFLAHELLHGFDPRGSAYDAEGRLRNWWTEDDAAAHRERTICVADDYSRLEYAPGVPIDGNFVVSEQFTELAASSISFEALRRATASSPPEIHAGLTLEQRYFVTAAQNWCADATDGHWRALAAGASAKAWAAPMVNGTVRNRPAFAEAFSCSNEDEMTKESARICPSW